MTVALKIVHIAVAAAWFGHKLLISRDVRESVHSMAAPDLFIGRIRRAERFGQVSGVLTLLSGLGLMYVTTGFAEAPLRIYLGLAAVIAMFIVGAAVARPAWKTIQRGLEAEDAVAASSAEPRLRQALMLENLLWILALGAMVSGS